MFIIVCSVLSSLIIIYMIARIIYKVWFDVVVSINQLKAKDGELSFKIRQLTIEVNALRNENLRLSYDVNELKDENLTLNFKLNELKDENSTLNFKLNELKHDNTELARELENLSEKIVSIDSKNVSQIEELQECVTEKFEQLSYASVYMGPLNGGFPINSEKITLVHGSDVGPYYIFDEYKNIPYFYNLKILDIHFDLLGNRNLPDVKFPDITNIHVKKLIIKNVEPNFHQRKIFESFPNLEELEINIVGVYGNGFTSDGLFDTTKYCNPSTKLKKIVFNQNKRNADHFTPVKEYYSTRGVEVVVNLVD